MGTIPRIIYSLWQQGRDEAPGIVRLNFERWSLLNPGYRLEIFDQPAAETVLADLPLSLTQLTPQAFSDVLRARLLLQTGGIWADASVFPTQSLDDWLPSVTGASGFFAFERPGPDRPISSWFLAATADNAMIRAWWQKVRNYWSSPRTLRVGIPDDPVGAVTDWKHSFPYFWFHYLFQELLDRDEEFASAWANCKKVPANAPCIMQRRMAEKLEIGLEEITHIATLAPVHKLDWRNPYPLELLAAL